MNGKAWSPEAIAYLSESYGVIPTRTIMAKLDRTRTSVHQKALVLGLADTRNTITAETLGRIRDLNLRGFTDPEIAVEIAADRHTVSRHRRELGLPGRRFDSRYRSKVAAKTREQLAAVGLGSLAEVRAEVFRRRVAAMGWPEGLKVREAEILDALCERGPMTRREIVEAIGMPWRGSRRSLKCKGGRGSYLANLIAYGLVVTFGRPIRGSGSGYSRTLYSPALTLERSGAREQA